MVEQWSSKSPMRVRFLLSLIDIKALLAYPFSCNVILIKLFCIRTPTTNVFAYPSVPTVIICVFIVSIKSNYAQISICL
jgi:hypothetical protein